MKLGFRNLKLGNGTRHSERSATKRRIQGRFCSMRSGVTFASLVLCLSSFVLFSACTDYVSQMEDDFDDWKKVQAELDEGSLMDITTKSSSSKKVSSSSVKASSSSKKVSSSSVKASSSSKKVSSSSAKASSSSKKVSSSSAKVSSSSSKKVSSSSVAKSSNSRAFQVVKGSFMDKRDNRIYETVRIGNQNWMAENLDYRTETTGCYLNEIENCSKYGGLYTWYDALYVCPDGWHLPSADEWNTLYRFVRSSVGGDTTLVGACLKSKNGWEGNLPATDDFGFSALPASVVNAEGKFFKFGYYAAFWSSTMSDNESGCAFCFNLQYDLQSFYNGIGLISSNYFSVRCIEDETTDIFRSSSSVAPKSSSAGSSVVFSGSTYNSANNTLTDLRDEQVYKTVTIGSQIWMAENLNYETANSYCYKDASSNCIKYGRLYTWDAAITACPSGWHLPTKAEFETLVDAVGGESTAGKVLKSTSGWHNSGNGTDDFGFSVLPAGYMDATSGGEGWFYLAAYMAQFWSSTEYGSGYAYEAVFYDDEDKVSSSWMSWDSGFSVRCLKD